MKNQQKKQTVKQLPHIVHINSLDDVYDMNSWIDNNLILYQDLFMEGLRLAKKESLDEICIIKFIEQEESDVQPIERLHLIKNAKFINGQSKRIS